MDWCYSIHFQQIGALEGFMVQCVNFIELNYDCSEDRPLSSVSAQMSLYHSKLHACAVALHTECT